MKIPETIVVEPQAVVIQERRGPEEARKKAATEQAAEILTKTVLQVKVK